MIRRAPFRWTPLNRAEVDRHALSTDEVEEAWRNRFNDYELVHPIHRAYFESIGPCPSGRIIEMVWRWNRVGQVEAVYVISAYGNWKP